MRVLLIGDYPPPHGGVAVHVQQLHAYLRAHGVETRVLDIGKGGRPAPDVLPVRTGRQLLVELARHAREGWTIHLHTSGNNPKAWALVGLVGAVPFVSKVVTLHSGLLPGFLSAQRARRLFASVALRGYSAVVSVSEAVNSAVAQLGVSHNRRHVLPAFLASQVRPGSAPEKLEVVRARRKPLLVMAHHPSPIYGRATMFEALRLLAREHPECGLALFGPGTREPAFEEATRGVGKWVENFGELEHGEALALIQSADVFVRPTTADGDSISVREALALVVPVVATDVCSRPEGTITCHNDAQSIATAVKTALVAKRPWLRGPDVGPALESLYESMVWGTQHAT